MTEKKFENIHPAYTLVSQEYIDEVKSQAAMLRHNKTGACIAVLSNDDRNKVFDISELQTYTQDNRRRYYGGSVRYPRHPLSESGGRGLRTGDGRKVHPPISKRGNVRAAPAALLPSESPAGRGPPEPEAARLPGLPRLPNRKEQRQEES